MRPVLLAGALAALVLAGCADGPAGPPADAAPASAARRSASGPGTPGLLWQNLTTGERKVRHMAGATWTGSETLLPLVEPAWSIGATGDFNRDGHPDIVWQKRTTGERTIWFMNGSAWSGNQQFLPVVGTEWDIAAAADFNADGGPDLVWQNTSTGERKIWLMSGATWTGAQSILPVVEVQWDLAAAADFNADGSPDLVWQKRTTGERTIWFMNGSTWSGNQQFLTTVDPAWEIAAAFPQPVTAPTSKPFYAWTSRYTSPRGGIRLQADEKVPMHESYDRQFVWAGNCERYFQADSAFIIRNKGRRLLYIVGDEPDHNQVSTCPNAAVNPYYTHVEYAQMFHEVVTYVSRFDSTARFSNGGFTHPGATPANNFHFTAYADSFIAAYRRLPGTGGQEPPVAEWRFNLNGVDTNSFPGLVNAVANWGRDRGKPVFIGSFDGDDMAARINAIKARPEIVGAAWWNFDSGWPWALSDSNGSLNALGMAYDSLTR